MTKATDSGTKHGRWLAQDTVVRDAPAPARKVATLEEIARDRARRTFQDHQRGIHRHTDRLFAGLMVFQWLAGIALAMWTSPDSWRLESGEPHPRVVGTMVWGGGLFIIPFLMAVLLPGRAVTRQVIAAGQMLLPALLNRVMAGEVETRFVTLGTLAFLAFYRDWRVLATASLVTVGEQLARGLLWPDPASAGAWNWRWVEHAGWVVFEDLFLMRACFQGSREMKESALRQAEAEVKSEKRFESLVNTVDGIVWEAEAPSMRFTFVSRQAPRLLGYPASQWLSDPAFWENHLHPEDRLWVLERSTREIAARKTHDLEYRMIGADGRTLWLRDSVSVISENGRVLCRGMMTDITVQKRIEKIKADFISMVSHELRTPLTSIHGSLGLLAAGAEQFTAQTRSLIEIAHRSSERLVRLIGDILDLNRSDAGKLSLVFKPIDLRQLLRQSIEDNRSFAQNLQVRLALEGNVPDVQVRGDCDRLLQVLANLVSNACKFSPRGATVEVSASSEGERVRVSVRDQGPGIPEGFRGKIFQRFAQAEEAGARRKGGSGLGLSIAKAIVEQHGGTIGFATETGVGTAFHFELPRWKPQGAAARPGPEFVEPALLVPAGR
jgi:PAS domain S-box-containing protein